MDRGWYVRFSLVLACLIGGLAVLWPSVAHWITPPPIIRDHLTSKINLGLDIQGGLRLMYEVEVDEAIRDRRDRLADDLLDRLGEEFNIFERGDTPTKEQRDEVRSRVDIQTVGEREISLKFADVKDADKLTHETVKDIGELKENSRDGGDVMLEIRADQLEYMRDTAVSQARETIANRIDTLGISETSVTARGTDIAVEIPGANEADFDRIRDIISRTARLEFKIVDDEDSFVAGLTDLPEGISTASETVSAGESKPAVNSTYLVASGEDARQRLSAYVNNLAADLPAGRELRLGEIDRAPDQDGNAIGDEAWRTYMLYARADVTGEDVKDAFTSFDPENNQPYVALNFNPKGADKFGRLTGRNVQRRMAILLDDRVETAPVIQSEIGGGNCSITLGGMRSYNEIMAEAKDLVVVLRAGALPAPIRPANEQLIGPTLGQDAIDKGARGALIGVVLVLAFVLVYYQVAGVVADLAVMLNLVFVFSLLAALGATLTLPGVAGIALTVGMAVDANVLINERIREELRAGKSPRSAVDQGYARAFWSIVDSQLTTFIAGVVLFQYGTGPIKGFAVTLMIGIVTSLFTGVFCSRVMFDWVVRGLRVKTLKVG